MVMEYLQGTDLRGALKDRKRLPIAEAVGIILQTCEAIGEAHALGIIHRDIKPQNIFLVTRAGAPFVKVLDFGLATMAAGLDNGRRARLTSTTTVIGSPQYMSPEQFESLRRTDARTDIWALGVILYQLIAGRRPFDGKTIEIVYRQVLHHTPAPLRTYQPETPPWLDALVKRCLEKDVAARVQSVAELVHGLTSPAQPTASFGRAPLVKEVPVAPPAPWPRADAAIDTPVSDLAPEPDRTTVMLEQAQKPRGDARSTKLVLLTAASLVVAASMLVASSLLWLRMRQLEAAVAAMAPAPAAPQAETKARPAGMPLREERVLVEATAAPLAPASEVSPAATASAVASAMKPVASAPPLPRISSPAPPPPRPAAAAAATAAGTATVTAKPSAEPAPHPRSEADLLNRRQ